MFTYVCWWDIRELSVDGSTVWLHRKRSLVSVVELQLWTTGLDRRSRLGMFDGTLFFIFMEQSLLETF